MHVWANKSCVKDGDIQTVYHNTYWFYRAFEKLQKKKTISFAIPACPSAWNNSAPTGRIFMEYGIWVFLISVKNIRDYLTLRSTVPFVLLEHKVITL